MFNQQGTWTPDRPIVSQSQGQSGQGNTSPMMQQGGRPNISQPQQSSFNPGQLQGFSPNGPPDPGHHNQGGPQMHMAPQPGMGQGQGQGGSQASPSAMINSMAMSPQAQQQGMGQQQFNPYGPQGSLPPAQSMMQQANTSSPQGMQNFLRSLGQGGSMSQTNGWQNPAGMQGQQAQAGFQGFQQNGQNQNFAPTAQYSIPNSPQIGYQQNGSPVQQSAQGGNGMGGMNGSPSFNIVPRLGTSINQMAMPNAPNYSLMSLDQAQAQQAAQSAHHSNLMSLDQAQAASDIASKQNIKSGETELKEFMDQLNVYSYEYKDSKYGDGRRISPMAQEIEKSPLGQAAISTNSEGYKVVDYGKLGGTMLASVALLNHKYDDLANDLKQAIKKGLLSKGKMK